MIKIQDWVAIIPPDEKHIAYVGEGQAEQRDFFLTGGDWQRYTDWGFHLDMAFDLTTVTTHDQRQTVKTQVSSSENVGETLVTSTATTTKESYTATDEQVNWDSPTDIAFLTKTVEADGIRLSWTVLRQHTQLPGKLVATLRAVSPTGAIKKSAIMVFEVDPAIAASPAAAVPVSEFEEMEARMDTLLEAVQQDAKTTANNAHAATTAAQEASGHSQDAEAYKTAAEALARMVAEQVDYVDELAMSVADSTALSESNAASARQAMLVAMEQGETAAGSASAAATSAEAAATRATEAAASAAAAEESATQAEDAADRVAPLEDASASSKTTWSSKNTVDRLCKEFTATGDVVQCYPVAGYPLTVEARGKNLIPQPYLNTSLTQNGITFATNEDGSVHVSGTASGNAFLYMYTDKQNLPSGIKAGETYTPSLVGRTGDNAVLVCNIYDGTGTMLSWTTTAMGAKAFPTNAVGMNIYILVMAGRTIDATLYPQLELGSVATAYEPFRESVTVWRGGKNLIPQPYLNTSLTQNGITFTANADGSVHVSGTASGNAFLYMYTDKQNLPGGIKAGETYTPSLKGSVANNIILMCNIYDSTGAMLSWTTTAMGAKVFPSNAAGMNIYLLVTQGATVDTTVYPQLEYGSVATAYEPYRGETITFSTAAPAIIPAQHGMNTLCADCGKVMVTGREDPRYTVDCLEKRIAALEAAVVNNG